MNQILDSSSNAKLEPFVLLSKSTRGAGCVQLITDALTASDVFVFSELISSPHIQELSSNPQHAPYLDLLKIFAYGTYKDYKSRESSLPSLNEKQRYKLRQLTLVTLATESRDLAYERLLAELELNNVRELENLIIDSIYHNVINGRLDQKNRIVTVDHAMGRDVKPGETRALMNILEDWYKRSQQAVYVLNERIDRAAAETVKQQEESEHYSKQLEHAKEKAKKSQQNKPIPSGFMVRELEFEDRAAKRSAKSRLGSRH